VQSGGRKPDEHVTGANRLAVDHARSRHGADDEAGDVVFAVGVEARHFRRLAAEQCAAVLATAAREPLHDADGHVGIQPTRREVVEEEERARALYEDVVDAVVDQVEADRVVDPGHEREAQLRPDAVRARHEHGIGDAGALERKQSAERADVREHAGRERLPREGPDAADDFVARIHVDA
jgi:hypothetical protein